MGKPRDSKLILLHDRYAERLAHLGVRYSDEWVGEVRAGGRFSDEHVREREGARLLERLGSGGRVVALDPAGESLTTPEFSTRLVGWATPGVSLVVGGPLGLHAAVRERAERCWSLSPLTFPHELVRVLVVEQVYRALTLLRGMPYHK